MTQFDLLTLLAYNYWANARILDCAERVTRAQLMEPANFDHQSAFQTLRHIVDVEWSWRLMAQQVSAIAMLWDVEDLSDLEKVRAFWRRDEATMRAYLESLDDDAVNAEIDYGSAQGRSAQSKKLWQIVMHIINHGTHHRSELARYFTDCGHSPGDIDFMDFLSQQ